MTPRSLPRQALIVVALGLLSACGGGTAALSGGSSSSSGSSPTTVSNVTVSDAKNSPAVIGFTLAGKSVDVVHIEYLPPPGAEGEGEPGEAVPIATLGPDDVDISKSGEANAFDWAFASDLGTGYLEGLAVQVRLGNGASVTTTEPIAVGNSPPVISPFSFPATEITGVVGMLFTVADTSDTVSLSIEVNADESNGFPEGSWQTALPDLGEVLVPFVAVASGTTVSFHWDVVGQFGPLDSEVMVRATAVDSADPGEKPLRHEVDGDTLLRVDNNAPPAVSLDAASFLLSDDRRRGIVVPYTVSDAEGDTPDLVFQWTREGEPFEDLPDDEALLEEILDDPALRKQYRIATPYPMPIAGLARPTGESDTIELPELGSSQSHLLQYAGQPGGDLSHALDGYELELLRPSRIPAPLAATWSDNPLDGPVAALTAARLAGAGTKGGPSAYVLDRLGGMAWRVREIDLATGAVLAELANGIGEPDTMTLERGGAALLVAAHDFNVRVSRVDLDTLDVLAILDAPGPLPGDTIRGLASVGSEMVLATSGDELLRLNYANPLATTSATVLDGLATPWGVVVDPVHSNRVYLAERDFAGSGRVLSLDLDTLSVDTLISGDTLIQGAPGLPHPESLAIERGGRLAVLTDETPGDGTKELRALVLDNTLVELLTAELPENAVSLAAGPDDLRLLALGSGHDLAAGGGVVQRRTIVGYDPTRRVATVDAAFAPPVSSAQLWRARAPGRLELEAGVPRSAAYLWDSRDLPSGQGRALLRLTARDADASAVEHDGGRQILSGLAGEPLCLGGPGTTDDPRNLTAADLDGDGDLDLVSANYLSHTLTVFFQTRTGVFDPVPSLTLGGPGTTDGAISVAAADVDGDGDVDLVSANGSSDTLTVFLQEGPGVFDPIPSLTLGGPGTIAGPVTVAAADLDGDGDLDLVSANSGSSNLTLFFQTAAGIFDPVPLALGGPATTAVAQVVAAADLDGDGDVDLVSSGFGFTLTVFFQTAAGVFDPVPSLTLGAFGALSVAAADLDGDGDVDLVAPSALTSTILVFFQTGAGVFDPVPSLTLGGPEATPTPFDVATADLDGDGDMDLVSANFVNDTLAVFSQTEPGVYLPTLALGGTGTIDGPQAVAMADLDGDGDADIVSANAGNEVIQGNSLTVFFQTGAGVFDPVPSQTLGSVGSSAFPGGVAAADLDGDGDLDIVSANLGFGSLASSSLTVFFQTGTGVFEALPSLTLGDPGINGGAPGTTDGSVAVAAADLDGDGDVDIVSANGFDAQGNTLEGSDTLSVFFQTELGVFDPMPSLLLGGPQTTDGAVDLAAADLDGDGDADIVSANEHSDTLTVFFQAEPGVFGRAPSLILGGPGMTEGANAVAVADLDGDGDADIVSANRSSNTLTVFLQRGTGVFDPVPTTTVGGPLTSAGANSPAPPLQDGDGFADLTEPGFGPLPSFTMGGPTTTAGPVDVAAADLDGDGDLDLVSANEGSNTLTVFLQTGAGVFDPVPSITLDSPPGSSSPESVTVADLDGDGDADIVSVSADEGGTLGGTVMGGDKTLTVFFQRSAGVFESVSFALGEQATGLAKAAVSVAAADLDGDGDADIVSANGIAANLTVFYGSHEP